MFTTTLDQYFRFTTHNPLNFIATLQMGISDYCTEAVVYADRVCCAVNRSGRAWGLKVIERSAPKGSLEEQSYIVYRVIFLFAYLPWHAAYISSI